MRKSVFIHFVVCLAEFTITSLHSQMRLENRQTQALKEFQPAPLTFPPFHLSHPTSHQPHKPLSSHTMSAGPSGSRGGEADAGSGRAASFPDQVSETFGPDVDFAATDRFLHPVDPANMSVEAYMYLNYRNMITLGDMVQASRLEFREVIAKLQKAE